MLGNRLAMSILAWRPAWHEASLHGWLTCSAVDGPNATSG